jgi:hypothetical protein
MALLKKKQKEAVPAELEAFYEREPAAKRWARRILAIIIIVALVAGLAWAAMKVYEQVTNRDVDMPGTNGGETAQQDTQGSSDTDDGTAVPDEGSAISEQEGTTGTETTEQPAASGTDDQTTDEGVVDSGAVSTTSDENLPSTGPADALWIILGVAAVSTLAYQFKLRRQ